MIGLSRLLSGAEAPVARLGDNWGTGDEAVRTKRVNVSNLCNLVNQAILGAG